GIIPVDAAQDEPTRTVIADIMTCLGPENDRSGKPGITQAKVEEFFGQARAYSDWWKKAEGNSTVLPLDGSTETAALTYKAVRPKIDDYFTRCRLAAFDPRASNALNREEKEYLAFAAKDLTLSAAEITGLPIAQVSAGKPLPLKEGLNPAWAEMMRRFEAEIVSPFLKSRDSVTENDWQLIQS